MRYVLLLDLLIFRLTCGFFVNCVMGQLINNKHLVLQTELKQDFHKVSVILCYVPIIN